MISLTSLQWALLILALALTLGLIGVNLYQARKSRARIESSREGQNFTASRTSSALMEAPAASVSGDEHLDTNRADSGPVNKDRPEFDGLNEPSIHERNDPVLERFNPPVDEPAKVQAFGEGASADCAAAVPNMTVAAVALKTDPVTNVSMNQAPQYAAAPLGDAWLMRSYGLHDAADCVIEILFDGDDIPAARLIQLTQATRRVGSKPVLFEGQSALNEWEPMVAGERFHGVRGGVLLANRNGPLNAMEFSEFATVMQTLGQHLDRSVDIPDMPATLNKARALDAQCADLDAQIGLNVICPEPLSTHDLSQVATEWGLAERGNNRFAALGEFGEVLFSVALSDTPNRLTFLLDVPRAPAVAAPWDMMVDCAQRCAIRYGAQLVDDADKPLSPQALARIGAQLGQRYQRLADACFVAGSPVALRLFN